VGKRLRKVATAATLALNSGKVTGIVAACNRSVAELGANNQITGFTRLSQPGIGQQLRDAISQRNETAQLAMQHLQIRP